MHPAQQCLPGASTTTELPGCREPLYAGAEKSAWWELCCLAQHMHPSCSAMACQLLAGTHTDYAGDPLRDHSLVAFLDKFVTRKPKVGGGWGRQLLSLYGVADGSGTLQISLNTVETLWGALLWGPCWGEALTIA